MCLTVIRVKGSMHLDMVLKDSKASLGRVMALKTLMDLEENDVTSDNKAWLHML